MKFSNHLNWTCEDCWNIIVDCECYEENFETEELFQEELNNKVELLASLTQYNKDQCYALLNTNNTRLNKMIIWKKES